MEWKQTTDLHAMFLKFPKGRFTSVQQHLATKCGCGRSSAYMPPPLKNCLLIDSTKTPAYKNILRPCLDSVLLKFSWTKL
jgi:hypothetical protein